ncbi:MAG: tRNA-His guanylyltransferase [Vezdaea aestivalis]|nr:MAG: tRNA-His guanylyltransferase [Vezdaea aestivalis]
MANSQFEYVKAFEADDSLLPNCWIVVRIDGRGFHKFSAKYNFEKPNDRKALDLMNAAATKLVTEIPDVCIAYGVSDEYSFIFHKSSKLFDRRQSKLLSTIVSTFSSYYVFLWPQFFPEVSLSPPLASFDARAVLYPSDTNLRDYLSWRQADCHINNLYNTTFWTLIQKGSLGAKEAEEYLAGTVAADKNEILFRFGINYNNEPDMYRKGSIVFRDYELEKPSSEEILQESIDQSTESSVSRSAMDQERKRRAKARVTTVHIDLIKSDFWTQRPWILSGKPGRVVKEP